MRFSFTFDPLKINNIISRPNQLDTSFLLHSDVTVKSGIGPVTRTTNIVRVHPTTQLIS